MVDTITFSQMTAGGDLPTDSKTPGLLGGANVLFNNPWTFLAPGTTGDRPVPSPSIYYRLRLNTTLHVYEYYDPNSATWAELSGSGTGTINPGATNDLVYYASAGQTVSPINGANSSVLITGVSGVPTLSTTLPSGLSIPGATITSSTASLTSGQVAATPSAGTDITNKTYVDTLVSGAVTSITGTANQVIASSPTGNVTLSLPQDIATGSTPTFLGLTLSSIPLGISSGGTNRSTLPTTAVASNYSAWDINSNLYANNLLASFATTVSAAGTTVLTVASAYNQEITGSTTQTVQMPVAATLSTGHSFKIINNSSGNVTLTSSGGNSILVMSANTTALITCVLNSGTTAASWNASYIFDAGGGVLSITGTANQVIASASIGNVTLSTPQDIATSSSPSFAGLTLSVTPLGLTSGGTAASLTASNGGIIYSTASAMAVLSGTATARQMLQSGASGAPAWSTTTYPATNAINTIMYASSANVLGSISAANSAVLTTNSSGVPAFSSSLTNGQLIIGSTGATPTAATLTAGANISITNGAGAITITATGLAGFSWTTVTGTSQTMVSNNGYIANNAGLVTLTLPASSAVGDEIDVIGKGAGGWKVQCGTGQTIVVGNSTTSTAGSVSSTQAKDSFYMICTVANTEWTVGSAPQSAGLTIA